MNEFIEKLIERLEETDLNDIQMVVREVLKKYGFPYESIVQDEVWDALDELSTNKFAIKIVNQLAEEYNNGWIPCIERLPEEYTEVLGYGIDGHIYMVKLYNTEIYGKVWKQWNGGDIRLKFIDAWQPLPAPYQPEGE